MKAMYKKKYNLSDEEKSQRQEIKKHLFNNKEKHFVDEPFTGYCDNTDHPLFTVKVTVDKPVCACYYCSKVYILKNKRALWLNNPQT